MNALTQMMMNQLKAKNPQAFKQYESFMRNGNDPREIYNQLTGNYTPEQRQNFYKFANNFGITPEQLQNIGINTKV